MLVVEDTADIRELLTEILTGEGYAVTAVQNGAEALEIIDRVAFELILLDLMMPVMNGFELMNQLARTGGTRPPVVAMSAFERFRGEACALGAESFLSKPVDVDRLLDEIARVIASGRTALAAQARAEGRPPEARPWALLAEKLRDLLGVTQVTCAAPTGVSAGETMLVLQNANVREDLPGGLFARLIVQNEGRSVAFVEIADTRARVLLGEEILLAQAVADDVIGRQAGTHDNDLAHDIWGPRLTELIVSAALERCRREGFRYAVARLSFEGTEADELGAVRDALGGSALCGWSGAHELTVIARPEPGAAAQVEAWASRRDAAVISGGPGDVPAAREAVETLAQRTPVLH